MSIPLHEILEEGVCHALCITVARCGEPRLHESIDLDSRYDRIPREIRLRPQPSYLAVCWSLLAFAGHVFDIPSLLDPSTTPTAVLIP